MKVKFISGDGYVESQDFTQASLDFIYYESNNKYNKRFFGQLLYSNGVDLCNFLETKSLTQNPITIEFYKNDVKVDSLENGKLFSISRDIVNDYCRIEIRENWRD